MVALRACNYFVEMRFTNVHSFIHPIWMYLSGDSSVQGAWEIDGGLRNVLWQIVEQVAHQQQHHHWVGVRDVHSLSQRYNKNIYSTSISHSITHHTDFLVRDVHSLSTTTMIKITFISQPGFPNPSLVVQIFWLCKIQSVSHRPR
jgi:hypothetical protein